MCVSAPVCLRLTEGLAAQPAELSTCSSLPPVICYPSREATPRLQLLMVCMVIPLLSLSVMGSWYCEWGKCGWRQSYSITFMNSFFDLSWTGHLSFLMGLTKYTTRLYTVQLSPHTTLNVSWCRLCFSSVWPLDRKIKFKTSLQFIQ